MQENSWGTPFCANTCGACICTRAKKGQYFWGTLFQIVCQILEGIHFGVNTGAACTRSPCEHRNMLLASFSRMLNSTQIRGVPKSEFSGSRKRGEVRGEKWWESEQGLKGKGGVKTREKGWKERGPKAHSKNSEFGTPMI